MWAPLLLAGFLSGWWGALALAAAPPAIRDTPGEEAYTTTANIAARHYRPPSMSLLEETVRKVVPGYHTREFPVHSWSETRSAHRDLDKIPSIDPSSTSQDPAKERERSADDDARPSTRRSSATHEEEASSPEEDPGPRGIPPREEPVRAFHPKTDESALTRAPRHSSTQTPFAYPPTAATESSMTRSRVARSAKQRPKNRTKADSPREQRRRCNKDRNKERNRDRCRGQNWCPDVDVGNRAYLAPTVFEGKARSMSSPRKPGSNYAVTFEVKQVYKSQPGFQPLQKNDSVRLHFRDKSASGKSTATCNSGHEAGGTKGNKQQQQKHQQQQQQQQRDNSSDVVRANIKRGKVYLVFVDRVGPRNFTILGEPVIRSKKNEQAVQAVVRPDYGESQELCKVRATAGVRAVCPHHRWRAIKLEP